MSTPSAWDDARIHAYVDGELDANTAARLEADSRGDATLAMRIARQRELKALLRGAFDPVLDEPIPQRLRDALAGPAPDAIVAPIGAARTQRGRATQVRWSLREWTAIAATLVLGLLVGSMALRTPGTLPLEMAQGRLLARGELDAALSTQLSGAAPAGAVTHVTLSFRAADGAYCRTFSRQDGPSGIACRSAGHWAVQLLDGSRATQNTAGTFRQAGSSLSAAMLDAITALGGGDALTAEQEQQQLRAGWK